MARFLYDVSPMRLRIACFFLASLVCFGAFTEGKEAPIKLILKAKPGDVTFDHAAHVKRDKGRCAACHDKLVPQSAKVALKSSTACGPCHHASGRAFQMKGNCEKCHGNAGAR